jgi:serine kinase of HPr protein (carbohydrate metabolism regulator)
MRLHASCVILQGRGVLLRGPSAIGKSDLALRLIDRGAVLVADDQVLLACQEGRLLASPPEALAGLLEVRGLGILRFPHQTRAPLALLVNLVEPEEVERMPDNATDSLLGVSLPLRILTAREPSADLKVRLAVQHAAGLIMSAP